MSKVLKLVGCLIFDIAVIMAFFEAFSFFTLLNPMKSVLALLFLLVSLAAINGAVIFPGMLYKRIGIAYSASIITVSILYAVLSGVLTAFLIAGSTVWYIFWQLILLAAFIGMLSVIALFSKRGLDDATRNEREQVESSSVRARLLEIEADLNAKKDLDGMTDVINSFRILKERINASTPFGRIAGNEAVAEIEDKIKFGLLQLQSRIRSENFSEDSLKDILKLIEDIRRLVINREAMNVR